MYVCDLPLSLSLAFCPHAILPFLLFLFPLAWSHGRHALKVLLCDRDTMSRVPNEEKTLNNGGPPFPLAVRTSARARFSYEKKKNEGTAEERENTTAKVIRQRGKIYGGLIIVCLASLSLSLSLRFSPL